MIKAVLFDADGVLINAVQFSKTLAKEHGVSRQQTEPFFTGPFRKAITGKANLKEIIAPYLIKWKWRGGVDAFLNYWFESEHHIDEQLVAYIQNLRVKNIKCYLATNQEQNRIEYMLTNMGFKDNFDGIYASSHLGHRKPTLKFYDLIVKDLKLKKDQILFWDNSEKNIAAAKHFGIHAEVYTTFEDFTQRMNAEYKL